MSDGEITAYHYMAISDGRSCELWAVTDPETGVIKGFASQDPFFLHPTGGDPPLSDPDPWDVTPYDE